MTTANPLVNSQTRLTPRAKWIYVSSEAGIFVGLFVLWQYLVWLKGRHTPVGAISRGRDIWHIEQWLHFPSEQWVQSFCRPIWQVTNTYYDFAHPFVMLAFVVYLLTFHRQSWVYFRRVLFLSTFIGLGIQFAISTAPPRFIGIPGLVDTADISGMSIYKAAGSAVDQYSTFPSLHVAWAAIVAICALRICKSRLKWIWFAHLPLTIAAVVITGNHFWLDCVSGALLVIIVSRIPRMSD